jgi:hypothetical protein
VICGDGANVDGYPLHVPMPKAFPYMQADQWCTYDPMTRDVQDI